MGSEMCIRDRYSIAGHLTQTPKSETIYIGLHVQAYLGGLDTEWAGRLTRWTLGVQNAVEAGDVIPPFPKAVATTPERTDLSLENNRSERGQLEQRDAALGFTESRQTMGSRNTTQGALSIYCGRALENFVEDSEFGYLWATFTCAHGEFVHATCMLDRAERLACGHTDPQSCVLCLSLIHI